MHTEAKIPGIYETRIVKNGRQDTDKYIIKLFLRGFLQSFKTDTAIRDVPHIRQQLLPSINFEINYSPTDLPFHAIQPKRPTESFNKTQINKKAR